MPNLELNNQRLTYGDTIKFIWKRKENDRHEIYNELIQNYYSNLQIDPITEYLMLQFIMKVQNECSKCKSICKNPFVAKLYEYLQDYITITYAPCKKFLKTDNGINLQKKLIQTEKSYHCY